MVCTGHWVCLLVAIALTAPPCAGDVLDDLGEHLKVEFEVIDNHVTGATFPERQFVVEIRLGNLGPSDITDPNWDLYFFSFRWINDETRLNPNGTALGDTGLRAYHINGGLFKMAPTPAFPGFLAGQTVHIRYETGSATASRTDSMPNWYLASPTTGRTVVIASTAGESLAFVSDFLTPQQWKRSARDPYDPLTAETRYQFCDYEDQAPSGCQVIPTPRHVDLADDRFVQLNTHEWVVVLGDPALEQEAQYLADKLGLLVVAPPAAPRSHYIQLSMDDVTGSGTPEAYRVAVDADVAVVEVVGSDAAGTFYGVQTLLSLYDGCGDANIPHGTVTDHPRFPYRGLFIDVSRNYHSPATIESVLDAMAHYKLNVLQLGLSNDEGWRLEVPGVEDMTQVGGQRCHDPSGRLCVPPQFGSAPETPNHGTGWYSAGEYRGLLRAAARLHITVQPELNMPGHAYAAVTASRARYHRLKDTNLTAATEFLLTDLDDTSAYVSVQKFINNAINPCLESTYAFIGHLMDEVIALHADIQPLKVFHFGGDEVPRGAWDESPACVALNITPPNRLDDGLMHYFTQRVAVLAKQRALDVAGWEEAFYGTLQPHNASQFATDTQYAFAWRSVWEPPGGAKAYILANSGYKVVLAHASYLYYDHPYEPDPEERGLYWATRYSPTRKTHGYDAADIYQNLGLAAGVCEADSRLCTPLQPGMEHNIIGMQGQLWSETVHTRAQLHYMIFPRLVALAERAWHQADWEGLTNEEARNQSRAEDWARFASSVGHKELQRLDRLGVQYALPPPGGRALPGGGLATRTAYPGLHVQCSTDSGTTWHDVTPQLVLANGTEVVMVTRSPDGRRSSRQVSLVVVTPPSPTIPSPAPTDPSVMTTLTPSPTPSTTPQQCVGAAPTTSAPYRLLLVLLAVGAPW